jgi:hypothetical protein
VSEFSTVASEDGATIGANDPPTVHDDATVHDEATAHDEATVHDEAEDPDKSPMVAVLRGGPAAGKQILIARVAGSFPLFIGVDGGNYVRDKGAHDRPVYNWWPAGASAPAGDPRARADSR